MILIFAKLLQFSKTFQLVTFNQSKFEISHVIFTDINSQILSIYRKMIKTNISKCFLHELIDIFRA